MPARSPTGTKKHNAIKTQELKTLEQRIVLKIHLLEEAIEAKMLLVEERIMARFDVLMENLAHDFRGAQNDRVELHQDKLNNHESRIIRLEGQAGIVTQ